MQRARGLRLILIGLTAGLAGCSIAPRDFLRSNRDPAPVVRARSLGMGRSMSDAMVVPTLLDKLNDPDAVVRMAAHEELRQRSGQDFGYAPWADATDRAAAINSWKRWWAVRQSSLAQAGAADPGVRAAAYASVDRSFGWRRRRAAAPSRAWTRRSAPRAEIRSDQFIPSKSQRQRTAPEDRTMAARMPDAAPAGPAPTRLADRAIGVLDYLGGLGILAAAAVGAPWSGRPKALAAAIFERLDEVLCRGLVLVGLIHVGFGSFLSMQAYYGATFTSASGAVVALGLLRNVAPLLTGFTLAGLMAVRITSEFAGGAVDTATDAAAGRATFVRLAASMLAGPLLVLWGASVGACVGALVCSAMLGVPIPIYFGLARQMLHIEDVMGVIVKGVLYTGAATLIACHEGVRARRRWGDTPAPSPPAFRAMWLSMLAILTINLSWFNVVYLSGSPFGPRVLGLEP